MMSGYNAREVLEIQIPSPYVYSRCIYTTSTSFSSTVQGGPNTGVHFSDIPVKTGQELRWYILVDSRT